MKKRRYDMILAAVLFFCLSFAPVHVLAAEYQSREDYYEAVTETGRVYDFANLLDDSFEENLQKNIEKAVESAKLDIVVLTVDQMFGDSQQDMADSFYDRGGFGYEEDIRNASGVLLLVDMENRQLYISTAGIAILYINDAVWDTILDDITEDATDGDYEKLCSEFVEDIVYYGNMAAATEEYKELQEEWYSGRYQDYSELYSACSSEMNRIEQLEFDYDEKGIVTKDKKKDFYQLKYRGYRNQTFFTLFRNPLVDVGIGAVVALIAVLLMKNSKNRGAAVEAAVYRTSQNTDLRRKEDRFLRRSTVSRKIESSSGGSKGNTGSSFHSSGGTSHGGGGRGF